MKKNIIYYLKQLIYFISSSQFFVITCFLLFILVFIGTIDQEYIGLYQAQIKYFSSFITFIYLGPISIIIIGGYILIPLITIGLLIKLIFNGWPYFKNIGILITHFGILFLLIGGIYSIFSIEGNMGIHEGNSSSYFLSNNRIELLFLENPLIKNKHKKPLTINIKNIDLFDNKNFNNNILPFYFNIKKIIYNSGWRLNINNKIEIFEIISKNPDKKSGLICNLFNNKIHIFEDFSQIINTNLINSKINILLQKHRIKLPFKIKLLKFKKEFYPGSNIPKLFKSIIEIQETILKQHAIISMNKPLNYKGYTIFQSSYINSTQNNSIQSVLSIVYNNGRWFPYIFGIITGVGLLLHIIINFFISYKK